MDIEFDSHGEVLMVDALEIAVAPNADEYTLDPESNGNVPVAVIESKLTGLGEINAADVRFGSLPELGLGTGAIPEGDGRFDDVDDDGDEELIFQFPIEDAGFEGYEERAYLWWVPDGALLAGHDPVDVAE